MFETDIDKPIASGFLLQFHIGVGISIAMPIATRSDEQYYFSISLSDAIVSAGIEPKLGCSHRLDLSKSAILRAVTTIKRYEALLDKMNALRK